MTSDPLIGDEIGPSTSSIPIIIVSARAGGSLTSKVYRLGLTII